MNTAQNRTLAALSSALLLLLVLHASKNDSFSEPSTFLGILVGVALATAAWFVGKPRQQHKTQR